MAFSSIPLPRVVGDVGPGGPLITALNALNDLRMKRQENQYYGPNMESQMANRNALTQGQNISNQYMPQQLQLQNALQELKNKFYAPSMTSEINNRNALTKRYNTMTPLEAQELSIKNQYAPDTIKANINSQNAMASWRNMGGGAVGAPQKDLNAFTRQLMMENPIQPNEDQNTYNQRINQMQSAYINGAEQLPNGQQLQPLSGTGQQMLTTIYNRNAPAAVKNQAANMDILVNDLKDFDIDAVKALAGPQGKAKLAYAKAQMAINPNDPNIDPMARRFLTAMDQSIINMDSMRKAFGTSVVPAYVYNTIGRLTNPSDSIWSDATQVGMNYSKLVETMEKNKGLLMEKVRKGVTAGAPKSNKSVTKKWVLNADGNLVESA